MRPKKSTGEKIERGESGGFDSVGLPLRGVHTHAPPSPRPSLRFGSPEERGREDSLHLEENKAFFLRSPSNGLLCIFRKGGEGTLRRRTSREDEFRDRRGARQGGTQAPVSTPGEQRWRTRAGASQTTRHRQKSQGFELRVL